MHTIKWVFSFNQHTQLFLFVFFLSSLRFSLLFSFWCRVLCFVDLFDVYFVVVSVFLVHCIVNCMCMRVWESHQVIYVHTMKCTTTHGHQVSKKWECSSEHGRIWFRKKKTAKTYDTFVKQKQSIVCKCPSKCCLKKISMIKKILMPSFCHVYVSYRTN